MPIDPPTGFLTRPEASRLYNRSQRALERDLDVALVTADTDTLEHWKLLTKDGQLREGEDVTVDLVKQLVSNGMSPTWCVEGDYLQERFGRKGDPKPRPAAGTTSPETQEQSSTNGADDGEHSRLPLDVVFLKQQIRKLEQEQLQERKRHDRIVAKLFEQLAVKDKQISDWDEVTQGLTRGLATGQLMPNLLPNSAEGHRARPEPRSVPTQQWADDGTVNESGNESNTTKRDPSDLRPADKPASKSGSRTKQKKTTAHRKTPPAKRKTSTKRRGSAAKGPASKKRQPTKAQPPKPKWYQVPTIKTFLSRK